MSKAARLYCNIAQAQATTTSLQIFTGIIYITKILFCLHVQELTDAYMQMSPITKSRSEFI